MGDRGGSTPATARRYPGNRRRNMQKHHYSKSANVAPDDRHLDDHYADAPSVDTRSSRQRMERGFDRRGHRKSGSTKRSQRTAHSKSRTMMVHHGHDQRHDQRGSVQLQPPMTHRGYDQRYNGDSDSYFIDDGQAGNRALTPEAAVSAVPPNGMRRGIPRPYRRLSPEPRDRAMDEWMSRTEMLEEENAKLKADVRRLKKAVRDLNGTVQQIMHTLQQQ